MTVDEIIVAARDRKLEPQDVDAFCVAFDLSLAASLDVVARAIATRYQAGTLDYSSGDDAMNTLFAYAATQATIPGFFFSVFQAFDAGEFYPDAVREPSPEERFTRPQIRAILGRDETRRDE
jgi:hypothetical protein